MCFVSINFLSRNLRQSQTLPQRRTYISFSTFFSVLAFQKTQINVNLFESSSFSYFLQVFPPKGPPRIIQNPNNPNRHKYHYWQSCGISTYQNDCLKLALRNFIISCMRNLRPFEIKSNLIWCLLSWMGFKMLAHFPEHIDLGKLKSVFKCHFAKVVDIIHH